MAGPGPHIRGQPPLLRRLVGTEADQTPQVLGKFVSNANSPQIDYRLAAGFVLVIASAVTPQGRGNAAEYQFGTHAQAIYSAEALKSFVLAPTTSNQGPTVRPIQGGPLPVDLTQQGWISKPSPARQGRVPLLVATLPQLDTTLQPVVTEAAVAPPVATTGPVIPLVYARPLDLFQAPSFLWSPVTPPITGQVGPAEYIFGTHAQALYQAEAIKSVLFKSAQTPPIVVTGTSVRFVIALAEQVDISVSGWVLGSILANIGPVPPLVVAPPQYDLTIQPQLMEPSAAPPVVSYGLRQFYASPQLVDLTQQGWIHGTAPGIQGPVPALFVQREQFNTMLQLAARFTPAAVTPPVVPNLHKLYYDVSSGRLFIRVSKTANPIEIIPL